MNIRLVIAIRPPAVNTSIELRSTRTSKVSGLGGAEKGAEVRAGKSLLKVVVPVRERSTKTSLRTIGTDLGVRAMPAEELPA